MRYDDRPADAVVAPILGPTAGTTPPGNATLDHLTDLAARLLGASSVEVSTTTGAAPVPGTAAASLEVPLLGSDGRVLGSLRALDRACRTWSDADTAVLVDLATAVVAELERVALAAEHETVSTRLDLAMDAAGVGSWDWDLRTGRLVWDDRLLRMFDYTAAEFDGTTAAFSDRLHPDDLPRVTASLDATIAGTGEYDETFRVVPPGRPVRWVSSRGRALRDETGTVVRMLGAASDITPRRLADEQTATTLGLLELVAQAGQVLSDSLEAGDSVRALARLVVPALAEWSVVSVVGPDGTIDDVECWHEDPRRLELTRLFAAHRFEGRDDVAGSLEALASGQPFVLDQGAQAFSQRTLRSEVARRALAELGLESVAVLPLTAPEGVIGLLTLGRGPGLPALSEAQLAAALEVARRAGTALQHARSFSRVRDISEQLQRSMLTEPVQEDGIPIAVRYTPASQAAQVGGDWYDAFVQPDGSTVLVVGDVIGHDSAAAAAMGQLRGLVRGIAYGSEDDPATVLTRLSLAVEGLHLDTIATAVVARLRPDPVSGGALLTWSNAGHPPPLLLHADGSTELLERHDLLLGLVADDPRVDHTMTLGAGSTLLMYTDGLVERRGESLGEGLARLREVVEAGRDLDLEGLVDHVHRQLVDSEPEDDVAVVAVSLLDR